MLYDDSDRVLTSAENPSKAKEISKKSHLKF